MDEPKKTELAGCAAIWDSSELLILGRKKWLSESTPWIMPGGGFDKDKDEYLEDTIVREVMEEIGITVANESLHWFKNYSTEWADKFVVFEIANANRTIYDNFLKLDFDKFFGLAWLDTSDKKMLELFWPLLMPGLRMYLKDKLGL